MTATTTTTTAVDVRRDATAFRRVRRMAGAVGLILEGVSSRWNDFVDAGQLGPREDTMIGRHTGGRI